MFSYLALLALPALSLVGAAPVDVFNGHDLQCLSPAFTGTPPTIKATKALDIPNLMLDDADANTPGSKAILSPSGMSARLDLSNGTVAAYMDCIPYYLNVQTGDKSFKPLAWTYERVENVWDAAYSQPLKAADNGSGNFLACRAKGSNTADYDLYLQTGSDEPIDADCFATELVISENTLHPVGF